MKRVKTATVAMLSAIFVCAAFAPEAYADRGRDKKSVRNRVEIGHDSGRSHRSVRQQTTRSRGHSRESTLNNLRQLSEFADRARSRHDDYRDRHRRHDADREYRRTQRDAIIANAIVDVVGIIANSSTYARPPVYTAPAPTYGHYEIHRVLVREGYYEQSQVWIPDRYDPVRRVTVLGHYETRQRYVPPVYEERRVWVGY